MDFEFHFRVFSFITAFIEQESVPLDKLDIESCCAAHENIVPREIFEQVFKYYTQPSLEYPGNCCSFFNVIFFKFNLT